MDRAALGFIVHNPYAKIVEEFNKVFNTVLYGVEYGKV
jgi:hypothetical protein